MLILRGITNLKKWPKYPRGALDEESAKEYAKRRGYDPEVLDVSGETQGKGEKRPQVREALARFSRQPTVTALYGFSGGGYNVYWILRTLAPEDRARLQLVVVLGVEAAKASQDLYDKNAFGANWELVYHNDWPHVDHIDGPKMLLRTLH
jgi:hypothetical protein